MKIKIKKIIPKHSGIYIIFKTKCGEAEAYWNGNEPIINQEYYVEFDINQTLTWGIDILNNRSSISIRFANDLVHISGILESIDDDGYSLIRVGENIIPFMATGTPFSIGSSIELVTKSVSLSPINY